VRLASILDRSGMPYWYSATHILGAKQWHDEIGRALAQCNWFLVVLTPDSVRSQWVKRELLFALNEERYHERIIPLLYKKCKYSQLSWTLPEYEFVDFTGDFEAGCRQLLRIWELEYKPAALGRRKRRP
jgi:TIR domain